jgi:hypothetical protein
MAHTGEEYENPISGERSVVRLASVFREALVMLGWGVPEGRL